METPETRTWKTEVCKFTRVLTDEELDVLREPLVIDLGEKDDDVAEGES